MSEDADFESVSGGSQDLKWTCPWPKCNRILRSFTATGLAAMKEGHLSQHNTDIILASRLELTQGDREWLKKEWVDADTVVLEDPRIHKRR